MPANKKHRGQPRGGANAPPAPPQSTYDGPGESPSRGRAPSTAGPSGRASTRGGSQTREARPSDPARDRPAPPTLVKNVDFGGQAYDIFSTVSCTFTCLRTIRRQSLSVHCSTIGFDVKGLPRKCLLLVNGWHHTLMWRRKSCHHSLYFSSFLNCLGVDSPIFVTAFYCFLEDFTSISSPIHALQDP